MDRIIHAHHIDETFVELLELSRETAHPAPVYIQYIGTIIDNTACILTGPANALDNKGRRLSFDDDLNWISAMQAVHRSFFSSIHSATEVALQHIAHNNHLVVESSSSRKVRSKIKSLSVTLNEKDNASIMSLANKHPQFYDYLDSVIDASSMNKNDKMMWRKYFKALGVIRNKVSHGIQVLSVNERNALTEGGFAATIVSGELLLNTRLYKQVCCHIIAFLTFVAAKPVDS